MIKKDDKNTGLEDDSSSVASTSVTSTASFLKEEVDIADLLDVVIDKDGPKDCVL